MKIKDLIKKLQEYDQDLMVVMSKDAEGNEFSPLSDVTTELYEADSKWSGKILSNKNESYKPNCITLWPVN